MLELHYWPTPNGKKVTILLEECGLPYKIVPVNIQQGAQFSDDEIAAVRGWLSGKAMSIYGGSFEVQNNIIAKNILGLPENTQRG